MTRSLTILAVLVFVSALARGQSACAELGVDCSHPQIQQRPSAPVCDASCRQLAQQRNQQYWEQREEYEKQKAAEKQERNEQKAEEKAVKQQNERIAQANKLSQQAWGYMQQNNCEKAVDLYGQALKLTKFLQWSENQTVCLGTLHKFDQAYAQWEAMIKDPTTPDADIRSMRMSEWNLEYDRGYICPVPPFFNGTDGCYRRPDHKTLDSIYVPLPQIDGKTWTAIDVISSGNFTVTTRDGHEWHNGEVNMTTLNLLDARIKTDKGTVVRFLLPDMTTFALGPESDITFDSFVYDPNESHSDVAMNIVAGSFRFVSGKLAHPDPASKTVALPTGSLLDKFNWTMEIIAGGKPACMDDAHPCILTLGTRGTDIELEHDPNGKGTLNEGSDRWWLCAYDGDIDVTADKDYPVPIGQCFVKVAPAEGWPLTYANNHSSMYLYPNYDDSPGAADTAITQKARLSVTDFWDDSITPPITGRQ